MPRATLEQRLKDALKLDAPPPPGYADFHARLAAIAKALAAEIDPGRGRAEVKVEPGHLLSAGQQFNVVVEIPSRNQFRDTLFRAYLKPDGSAATLDLFADQTKTVATPDEMEDAVVKFLSRPSTRTQVRSLREVAAAAP